MSGDKKYLIFALLTLTVLGVLFYCFIHLEKISEIDNIEAKITQNNKKIMLIEQFNKSHKNIDEEVSKLAQRHYRVFEALPSEETEKNILRYLSGVAANNKLEILNLNAVEQKNNFKNDDNKNYFTMDFLIKVKGDYFKISDFMLELYNCHNFLDVKSIDLKNNNGVLTLDLEICCYYATGKITNGMR